MSVIFSESLYISGLRVLIDTFSLLVSLAPVRHRLITHIPGILEVHGVSATISSIVLVITMFYAKLLARRRLYHVTFKLYQVSVFLYQLHSIFGVTYRSVYASLGYSPRFLYLTDRILLIGSTSAFLGVLLSFSNGYTIVVAFLSVRRFGGVVSVTALLTLLMLCGLVWEESMFYPATTSYKITPPGYLLAALYLATWLYFILCCVVTGTKYTRKTRFYTVLALFYSAWFLVVPLTTLIVNAGVPSWLRLKTVLICHHVVWIVSYVYLLVIFTPTHTNENFPFHLRVSKVGGMDDQVQNANDSYYGVKEQTIRTHLKSIEPVLECAGDEFLDTFEVKELEGSNKVISGIL